MSSIDNLIIKNRLKLGNSIKDRKKVYLDTKYWAYLCDVSLGKNADETLISIYTKINQLIKEKKIICPLSYRLYSELLKQKDELRLNKTASIMESLSENIMIVFETERLDYELLYFLYKTLKADSEIYEQDIFIWTKASKVLGEMIPTHPLLSEKENEYIQKEFFKKMWDYPFSKLVEKMKNENQTVFEGMKRNTINAINNDKIKFEDELKNQYYVYMSEIAGMLESYKDMIKNTFSNFATKETNSQSQIGNEPEDDIQPIINMIYNLFKQDKMNVYLPTYDINAKMYSTIRWNKNQNFKVNDLDDIGHTATALPYYDYFFTEKSFTNLIKTTKYDRKYSCIVEWEKHKVLEKLNEI